MIREEEEEEEEEDEEGGEGLIYTATHSRRVSRRYLQVEAREKGDDGCPPSTPIAIYCSL
jgi:hypothetical protein